MDRFPNVPSAAQWLVVTPEKWDVMTRKSSVHPNSARSRLILALVFI